MLMLDGVSGPKSPSEVHMHGYERHQIIPMSSSDTPLDKESGSLIPWLIRHMKMGNTPMDFYVHGRKGLRRENKALSNI